jgi:hypothetical protein
MIAALLVLGSWMPAPPAAGPGRPVPLHVRVYIGAGVDQSTVERSQEVARRLLASAGIHLVWRLCVPSDLCEPAPLPRREVPVIVSADAVSRRVDTCGRAMLGEVVGSGAVRVSVACVAGLVRRLHASRSGPLHPLLQSAADGDLLGAVQAHELGHVLGLQHAPGVMHTTLDENDILALRRGQLSFTPSQSARMRALLAEPTGEALAGRPEP